MWPFKSKDERENQELRDRALKWERRLGRFADGAEDDELRRVLGHYRNSQQGR